MAEIGLTRGLVALVDDEDLERLAPYRWAARPASNTPGGWYAHRNDPVLGTVYLHRQLMGVGRGDPDVDHVNGDGLDNRRANLRLASRSQNLANRGKQRGTYSSRYKGVTWLADCRRWKAYVGIRGRTMHLGLFTDERQAALAYDRAALDAFGEFARLNFPEVPA